MGALVYFALIFFTMAIAADSPCLSALIDARLARTKCVDHLSVLGTIDGLFVVFDRLYCKTLYGSQVSLLIPAHRHTRSHMLGFASCLHPHPDWQIIINMKIPHAAYSIIHSLQMY